MVCGPSVLFRHQPSTDQTSSTERILFKAKKMNISQLLIFHATEKSSRLRLSLILTIKTSVPEPLNSPLNFLSTRGVNGYYGSCNTSFTSRIEVKP